MKKLLILGSCSAVVVLMLGAAACARLNASDTKLPLNVPSTKCMESTHEKGAAEGGCLEKSSTDLRSELFLRPMKKKDRKAYA